MYRVRLTELRFRSVIRKPIHRSVYIHERKNKEKEGREVKGKGEERGKEI